MNMFARFDENPAMTLQVIKKTKVTDGRTDGRTDVKTVYPTTNKVCGGYNENHAKGSGDMEWTRNSRVNPWS